MAVRPRSRAARRQRDRQRANRRSAIQLRREPAAEPPPPRKFRVKLSCQISDPVHRKKAQDLVVDAIRKHMADLDPKAEATDTGVDIAVTVDAVDAVEAKRRAAYWIGRSAAKEASFTWTGQGIDHTEAEEVE